MSVPPEEEMTWIRSPKAVCAHENTGAVRTAPVQARIRKAWKDPIFTVIILVSEMKTKIESWGHTGINASTLNITQKARASS